MSTSASGPRFERGEVAKTTTSMSFDGCRPASVRNAAASPSIVACAVCWNSAPESGLVRSSASFTTPTDTASLGTRPMALVRANANGASASSAAVRNSFFISELLSSEQPGSEDQTDDGERAGGEERRPGQLLREFFRRLSAGDERHHRPAQLRGLGHDPVERVDPPPLPLLGHGGGDPLVADQHHAEEEEAVRAHDGHGGGGGDDAHQEGEGHQRGDDEENHAAG